VTIHWPLRTLATVATAGAALVLTATAASAAGPGSYTLAATTGATFSVLSTGNLVNVDTDDSLHPLSTSGHGLGRLPFPVHAFDQTYQNIVVDSNGNIRLGTKGAATLSADVNGCLTTAAFGGSPDLMAYWDDLTFRTADTSHGFPDGIFTKTSGTAPHRKFVVSWQGTENVTQVPVLAQVVFQEGSQTVQYVYGTDGGASATVGIQSKQQLTSTQWTCSSGSATAVTAGLRITATHSEGTPPM
jgi:hypothetical protein